MEGGVGAILGGGAESWEFREREVPPPRSNVSGSFSSYFMKFHVR